MSKSKKSVVITLLCLSLSVPAVLCKSREFQIDSLNTSPSSSNYSLFSWHLFYWPTLRDQCRNLLYLLSQCPVNFNHLLSYYKSAINQSISSLQLKGLSDKKDKDIKVLDLSRDPLKGTKKARGLQEGKAECLLETYNESYLYFFPFVTSFLFLWSTLKTRERA